MTNSNIVIAIVESRRQRKLESDRLAQEKRSWRRKRDADDGLNRVAAQTRLDRSVTIYKTMKLMSKLTNEDRGLDRAVDRILDRFGAIRKPGQQHPVPVARQVVPSEEADVTAGC
jgi:hypothetical protein